MSDEYLSEILAYAKKLNWDYKPSSWKDIAEQQQQTIQELAKACKNAGRVLREFYEEEGIDGNQPQVLKLEALAAQHIKEDE